MTDMCQRHAKTSLIVFCLIMIVVSPRLLRAAVLQVTPSISLRGEYNDNLLLRSSAKKSVLGTTLAPGVGGHLETQRLKVNGNLSMDINRYINDQALDTTDYFSSLSPMYEMDWGTLKLTGTYGRDSTLQTELLETGLALSRTQRTRLTAAPSLTWSVTQHSVLEIQYQLTNVDYSGGETLGLFDFEHNQGTARFSFQIAEKDQLSLDFSYSVYNVPTLDLKSRTLTGRVGISHDFYEGFKTTFLVGGYRSDQQGLQGRKVGFSLYGSAEKVFERSSITTSVSRAINPSGSGALLQNDIFSLSVRRQLTIQLSGSLALNLYRNRFISQGIAGQESRYYRAHSALHWKWAERWVTTVSYRYAKQKTEGSQQSATANAVNVAFTYRWPGRFFSP